MRLRAATLSGLALLMLVAFPTVSSATETLGPVTEYAVPGGHVYSIALGPDGNLWFTTGSDVGRLTPAGAFTMFSVADDAGVLDITAGPDGNMWFTAEAVPAVGKITLDGQITLYPVAEQPDNLRIAAGPDGNLWITENFGAKLARITPNGVVTEFALDPSSQPIGIVGGSDGNVWFAEENASKVGKITPDGVITLYPNPDSFGRRTNVLALGADGNIWINEPWPLPGPAPTFGRVTPDGVWTSFDAPEAGSEVMAITAAADGNVWFAQFLGTNLSRVSSDGAVTTYSTSITGHVSDLAAGLNDDLWFAEVDAGIIGTVHLPTSPGPTLPAPVLLTPRFTG